MKEKCLDIGIIQAFLDGEIGHEQSAEITGHIASCRTCAAMLAEAEDESAVVFSALEREFNTLVPTQRLWSKINESLAAERENRSFWQKSWAFLSVALVGPSGMAAAALIILVGIFSTFWISRTAGTVDTAPEQANVRPYSRVTTEPVTGSHVLAETVPDESAEIVKSKLASPVLVKTGRAAGRLDNGRETNSPRPVRSVGDVAGGNGELPGEESYVKTIASLSKTVNEQKDGGVMRPSERFAYERDMSFVNDTIAKMKKEVQKNPKNDSARGVLYSSYQNKIDLLNSVAQKEELVASLK